MTIRPVHPIRSALALGALSLTPLTLTGCADQPTASEEPSVTPVVTETPTEEAPTETPSEEPSETPTDETPDDTTESAKAEAIVALTSATALEGGSIEARGFVQDVVAEGSCRATAIGPNGARIEAEHEAVPDAKTTNCVVELTGAEPGTWEVRLAFENDEVAGESDVTIVEVA